MSRLHLVKEEKYWLLGIAAALMMLHLNLTWKHQNTDLLSTSLLFWATISFLIWKKRLSLNLESGVFSSFLGISLIAFVLVKTMYLSSYDLFLRISPFISVLGLSLLASGIKGFKQYWQELVLVFMLAIPPGLISAFIDLSILTAKFSVFVLWFLGFEVSRQGVMIVLPRGSIEVGTGCDGVGVILQLLGLAFICLVLFPAKFSQKIFVPLVAVLLAFVVNGTRVALMAVLAALSNQQAFEYWHTGSGSLIFSTIAVLLFGLFCHFTVLEAARENEESLEV